MCGGPIPLVFYMRENIITSSLFQLLFWIVSLAAEPNSSHSLFFALAGDIIHYPVSHYRNPGTSCYPIQHLSSTQTHTHTCTHPMISHQIIFYLLSSFSISSSLSNSTTSIFVWAFITLAFFGIPGGWVFILPELSLLLLPGLPSSQLVPQCDLCKS